MMMVVGFADFGPAPGSEVGARNGQERVKCGPERPIRADGEVRRRLQEPSTTRGNRRDKARKNPNREGLGFKYWWWGGILSQSYLKQRLRSATNSCGKERKPAPQCRQSYQFPPAVASAKCLRSTSSSIRVREPNLPPPIGSRRPSAEVSLGNHHC